MTTDELEPCMSESTESLRSKFMAAIGGAAPRVTGVQIGYAGDVAKVCPMCRAEPWSVGCCKVCDGVGMVGGWYAQR